MIGKEGKASFVDLFTSGRAGFKITKQEAEAKFNKSISAPCVSCGGSPVGIGVFFPDEPNTFLNKPEVILFSSCDNCTLSDCSSAILQRLGVAQ